MEVSNVSQTEFESMFGGTPSNEPATPTGSGFSFDNQPSIFKKTEEPITDPLKPDETKTPEQIEKERLEAEEVEKNKDKSLFDDQGKPKADEAKANLDLKNYFEKRIKDGAFLSFEDDKLETPEDFDALIEANFNHKIEKIQEDLETRWYDTKTNAWKFVAQYADNLENPYDLLPVLQGIQNIETVSSLDPKEPDQAERIVRAALQRRGESPAIIEDQITTFKEGNKLEKLAADYQPLLIQEENQKLAKLQQERIQEEQANLKMINEIHENAIKVIETPFLGKHKLKKEEKAAVYDLIAQPDQDSGGYKIFRAIDNLYANKDFETLREVALLLGNKTAHRNYLGIENTNEANEKLLRKLKDVQTAQTTSTTSEPDQPRLPRPTAKPGESGFGFFKK